LNKNGWVQKNDEAAKKAQNLRKESRDENQKSYKIKDNAGLVRAHFNITNESLDMPVRLSNIRCSFLLQKASGEMIPIQSFILRNDDYSIFQADIYGSETVGPYVIDLPNLNTAEIRDSIIKGYTPKIIILDYEMTHVKNSNYKTLLASPHNNDYSGDNVKIIEERVKGRTSGIKIVAPNKRKYFRVAAFDLIDPDSGESIKDENNIALKRKWETAISPGVSMEKGLKRISYSGTDIKTANYVMDLSGIYLPNRQSRFHFKTIASIDNMSNNIPLDKNVTVNPIIDGDEITYIIKPVSEWSDEEIMNSQMWTIFADGKYYDNAKDKPILSGISNDTSNHEIFSYSLKDGTVVEVPKIKGIENIIWAGDHYDIVLMNVKEMITLQNIYGTNPIESG
jgi:hypothetical protein